jgi:hypothetical protein
VLITRDRFAGAGMQAIGFVRLDIIFAVQDPLAQLEISRALTGQAPALKSARAYAPTAGELVLV